MAFLRLATGAEFDLIRRFYEAAPDVHRRDVRVGPGDDACVVAGDGIAVSTDVAVEDVHFRRDWLAPEEIGWRSAAAALSDLAAMGARPIGVLASLAAPDGDVPAYAEAVMSGLRDAATSAGAALLGGDVSRSPNALVVDVVVLGECPSPLLRSGMRPGDELWVTGRLGGAAAAVDAWLSGRAPDAAAREAFAQPRPRVTEARWLAETGVVQAAIDLSDGLAGDAEHVAAASGVRVVLEATAIPIHPSATRAMALGGGEDYELCFAARAGALDGVAEAFRRRFDLSLTRVGEAAEGSGVWMAAEDGAVHAVDVGGFRHFARP